MWNLFSKKISDGPIWYQTYLQQEFKPENTGIDDFTFVVLDCETTGLKRTDQLITVGAVKCTSNSIALDNMLDQKYPFLSTGQAAEIHGELHQGGTESKEQLLEQLIRYLGNHVIVGHNIAFDIGIISEELKKLGGGTLKNKVLDTAQMTIRLDPQKYARAIGGTTNLHLDDLCKHFSIPVENRHTALGDAYLTALLFQRLLNRLKKRGIKDVQSLLR